MAGEIKFPDINLKLRRAKVELTRDFPFFSDILFFMQVNEVLDEQQCPTMGVDIKGQLYYNPKWVEKLSLSELQGTLVHECIHPAYLHLIRGLKKENQIVWNLAADCHAQMIAHKAGFDIPSDLAAQPDRYSDSVHLTLKDGKSGKNVFDYTVKDVEKKCTEEIYAELMSKMPQKLKDALKAADGSRGSDKHYYKSPDGKELIISDEELDRIADEWKQRTVNAGERAKAQGLLPAGMERYLGEILESKVDWRTLLYEMVVSGIPSDRTWLKRDRRYAAHGFYIPDQKRESVDVISFIDTSGSIGDTEISEFKSENIAIKHAFDSVKMVLGFCDSEVSSVLYFDQVEENDIMDAKPTGGGGTDMRKCVEWVRDNAPDATTLVILTDGYTPFPEKEDVPSGLRLLWIISPNGIKESDIPDKAYGEFVFMGVK